MALYPYYPYQQNGYGYNPSMQQPVLQQPVLQQTHPQTLPQQQAPMMSSDIIHVQSENEARHYPVAPGNCITFKDDVRGFCYTKTQPVSQFEPFSFKKFKLVEIIDDNPSQDEQNAPSEARFDKVYNLENYALKADVERLSAEIESLTSKIESLTAKARTKNTKEAEKNEQPT